MGLTRTCTLENAGGDVDASTHRTMLLALDELLEARFNERSWWIFTAEPQLPPGEIFIFGTPDNLAVAGTPYDTDDEDNDPPTGGEILSYDAATKVVWVDGSYSDAPTLNRKTVEWQSPEESEPSTWWLGIIRAERFLPLGLADIVVEDYEDPVASANTTFTWRSHWDRYGCIRVHNGNRFSLTLAFEGGAQSSVTIPAYGIVCGRRTNHDQPFVFASTYLPLTASDDPAKWEPQHAGQSAASLEIPREIFNDLFAFCRLRSTVDSNSTSREQGSFTGSAPSGTDKVWEWFYHRGKLLSVILDKRDGTIVSTELTWSGFGTSWPGHVVVDHPFDDQIRFTSDASAPSGAADEEWEHDLIPISTNITQRLLLNLHNNPVTLNISAIGTGQTPAWSRPFPYSNFTISTHEFFSPGGGSYEYPRITTTDETGAIINIYTQTIGDAWPDATVGANLTVDANAVIKCSSALVRYQHVSMDDGEWGMCEIANPIPLITDASTLRWVGWTASDTGTGRRFTARQPRKYMAAGEVDGSSAVYNSHPQDTDIDGTGDGLGGALGWAVQPILSSQVAIEGDQWLQQETLKGRDIYEVTDVLHAIHEHIGEANWYLDHRDDLLANTLDPEDKLLTWRVPRLVEHFNDLARSINAVLEVFPATIRDLHKDPLPVSISPAIDSYPFGFGVWEPFAVPAGWVDGRYDSSDVLQDWATIWGITLETGVPDIDAFRTIERPVIYAHVGGHYFLGNAEDNTGIIEETDTINGETFNTWNAWSGPRQLLLFGGVGTDTGYKWLDYVEAVTVFGQLGVAVPRPPCGEWFTPKLETPSSLTEVIFSGPESEIIGDDEYLGDAIACYRLPSGGGSWIRVIPETFRLVGNVGSLVRRIAYFGYDEELDPVGWNAWELADSSDARANMLDTSITIAPHGSHPADIQPRLVSASGDVAWPTLRRVDFDGAVLLIASPEPWWDYTFDGYPGSEEALADLHTFVAHDPDMTEGLFFREVPAEDMPITVEKIKTWAESDWEVWHCQVVPRTGILRELTS